jgi:hypothetical protein
MLSVARKLKELSAWVWKRKIVKKY